MITGGGRLPTKHVIHTVGPIYRDRKNNEAELLASCHRECIRIADKNKITSLAFPAISTGVYGYPLHEAAEIAVNTVLDVLDSATHVNRVHFVLFDASALKAYVNAAQKVLKDRPRVRLDSYRSPKAV